LNLLGLPVRPREPQGGLESLECFPIVQKWIPVVKVEIGYLQLAFRPDLGVFVASGLFLQTEGLPLEFLSRLGNMSQAAAG
jgi:hypothetical protein